MKYNVAVQQRGYTFLLSIDGFRTIQEAKQAIRWQREGEFHQVMYIVEPWPDTPHCWRIIYSDGPHRYHPEHYGRRNVGQFVYPWEAGWTKRAWEDLLHRFWPTKNQTITA